MYNKWGAAGAFFMALAVLSGAFGAHGLQKVIQHPSVLEPYKTAVQYLFFHGLALLVLWSVADRISDSRIRWIFYCFFGGILLFCGSLFLLTFSKLFQLNLSWVGGLTPVGGFLFITGWLLLAGLVWRKRRN